MAPETCYKDPDEVAIYTFDFTRKVNPDETVLAIISIVVTPSSGITLASNTVLDDGLRISTKISGGSAGSDYVLTAKVTTSDGETLEESGRLRVRSSAEE
jgi:hypothetical protein